MCHDFLEEEFKTIKDKLAKVQETSKKITKKADLEQVNTIK
jgi:hypothetical protein